MGSSPEDRAGVGVAVSDRAGCGVGFDDVLRLETQVVLHDAARKDYESAVRTGLGLTESLVGHTFARGSAV